MDHRGRRSLRLPDYDYSQAGIYFITICTHKKRILLAHIIEDRIRLTTAGHIVQSIWESLHKRFPTIQTDSFVVMPNHIHGIIIIIEDNVGAIHELPLHQSRNQRRKMLLPKVIGYLKMNSSKQINLICEPQGKRVWQRTTTNALSGMKKNY
jgi:REP element-mobilizing transposase RayT